MQRVMIIGGSGAGKSSLACAIGARTGLPAIHMDRLFWEPGWVMPEENDFLGRVAEVVATDTWVMDGNYSRTWPGRLQRADTVIFLDLSTWRRFWRVVRRTIGSYGQSRPDIGEGCLEHFDPGFLFGWVLQYRWRSRHKALALMAPDGAAAHAARHHLRTPREVQRFLDTL